MEVQNGPYKILPNFIDFRRQENWPKELIIFSFWRWKIYIRDDSLSMSLYESENFFKSLTQDRIPLTEFNKIRTRK